MFKKRRVASKTVDALIAEGERRRNEDLVRDARRHVLIADYIQREKSHAETWDCGCVSSGLTGPTVVRIREPTWEFEIREGMAHLIRLNSAAKLRQEGHNLASRKVRHTDRTPINERNIHCPTVVVV
jgi:hypothetical protein